ncbi:MAG TPA: hypothetical protein VKR31_01535 [Rhizomicrobium sp.]|nr:hypothetical protein [Rhizomicrobium sp.]
MKAPGRRQDLGSRTNPGTIRSGHDILSRFSTTRPAFDASRVYRDAHARYAQAFRSGDVNAIEEAFSRMQELGRAFRDGAQWAEEKLSARKGGVR